MAHYLPYRLPSYLNRLSVLYNNEENKSLRDIITSSRFHVIEETSYDNWNGGTYGHSVTLYVPIVILGQVNLDLQEEMEKKLCSDINRLAKNFDNEHFDVVAIELEDDNDPSCQSATPFSIRPIASPDAQPFWTPGLARLFISHRDIHKIAARELAESLNDFAISSFVAHDTIAPMTQWREEIVKGLDTMEVMLAFITDDFDDSIWTNQEIGFALGKGIPIVPLKLGIKDPSGFISHLQAIKGDIGRPTATAKAIYPLIYETLGRSSRLQDALINSFISSPSWTDAKSRFILLDNFTAKLTDEQVERIMRGFSDNSQLYNSAYLTSHYQRMRKFLERVTNKKFLQEGSKLHFDLGRSRVFADDDIPF